MSSTIVVCYYDGMVAQMVSYILLFPMAVSLIISALGWMVGTFTLVCYGSFLFVMNSIIGAAQSGMHMEYMDPMCPERILPSPPCMAAFYIASLVTFFICSFVYFRRRPSFLYIIVALIGILLIPFCLVWFQYFSFWDVFIMMYIGILTTIIFFFFMFTFVFPEMHYMFSNSIIRWFEYGDRKYMTKTQILLREQDLLVTKLLEEKEKQRVAKTKLHNKSTFRLPEWGGHLDNAAIHASM